MFRSAHALQVIPFGRLPSEATFSCPPTFAWVRRCVLLFVSRENFTLRFRRGIFTNSFFLALINNRLLLNVRYLSRLLINESTVVIILECFCGVLNFNRGFPFFLDDN